MTIIDVARDQAPQWKKANNGVGSLRHEISFLDMFNSRFFLYREIREINVSRKFHFLSRDNGLTG